MKNLLNAAILVYCFTLSGFAISNPDTVKEFVAAFNQKDTYAMLGMAAPDMKWLSIAGHQISVETSNHEELKSAMQGYFDSMPSAKSKIRDIRQSGHFVYTLEEAFWTVNDVVKSQCSMAVYEFLEDKLQHVWYFPAHQC